MNWISVVSSNLDAVAYDASSFMLYIRFKSSGTYVYSNVPPNIYEGLMSASSHGEYHAQYIKNSYRYAKI